MLLPRAPRAQLQPTVDEGELGLRFEGTKRSGSRTVAMVEEAVLEQTLIFGDAHCVPDPVLSAWGCSGEPHPPGPRFCGTYLVYPRAADGACGE